MTYFTYNGRSSAEFGLHIEKKDVFSAPEYDAEFISIPGRSGDIINPNRRFANIKVTYVPRVFVRRVLDCNGFVGGLIAVRISGRIFRFAAAPGKRYGRHYNDQQQGYRFFHCCSLTFFDFSLQFSLCCNSTGSRPYSAKRSVWSRRINLLAVFGGQCIVYHQRISNWVFECSTAFALKRIK